ncbi:unnamed protein product [Arabidopsis arenosa]|uniref:Uncharacterized protein n=1 Tax=Arabidopsis arenosa TaxID=38785 RepID=A0A8S1ZVM9_ARAAE|nr:unnamed protein product [Arabidopsis arenosa]
MAKKNKSPPKGSPSSSSHRSVSDASSKILFCHPKLDLFSGANSDVEALDKPSWVNIVKSTSQTMRKKGKEFTLTSGELCVEIPEQAPMGEIHHRSVSRECS